ncbi:UTP--glucose-1-phosphate uridylyltransferase GalU [Acidobacteriota bacterium]
MEIRKAVFPAAGLGTRFLPATKAQPKEMLPIVDKPMIQYVIEEAKDSGIQNVIIVTGRGKNAIEDHFDVSIELEQVLKKRGNNGVLEQIRAISDLINFSYIRQKEALGLGHAIGITRELVGNEPFAVLLGDDIIDAEIPALKQMINVYQRYKCSVLAIEKVDPSRIESYGVIAGKKIEDRLFSISDLVEKPKPSEAPSDMAIIGRYILTPEIFDFIENTQPDENGEIQITNALRGLLKRQAVYGYLFEGIRYDAGSKIGFLKATVEFALKRDDLGTVFKDYLKSLTLE